MLLYQLLSWFFAIFITSLTIEVLINKIVYRINKKEDLKNTNIGFIICTILWMNVVISAHLPQLIQLFK